MNNIAEILYGWNMESTELKQKIETLVRWIFESSYLVVFTGAGISTESGLPDFRGPDGLWTRKARGLPVEQMDFSKATPNSGHMAIVELQNLQKLKFLISQNVDNLHLKSGISPEILAELHGNVTKLRCEQCEFTIDNTGDEIRCPLCGGTFKPSVVNFGQPLPQKDLAKAYYHSERSDLFIVVGSSLVVYPAADMPRVALENGARLVIINQGKTPFDEVAHLLINEKIGLVLPQTVARLKELLAGKNKV
ncbi:MAG: NAD-dependent protein deacylase [Dehalococcoidales bacterium]|nr:NAD-dependent protein deacylase [Dehalococcoidales bacterium]